MLCLRCRGHELDLPIAERGGSAASLAAPYPQRSIIFHFSQVSTAQKNDCRDNALLPSKYSKSCGLRRASHFRPIRANDPDQGMAWVAPRDWLPRLTATISARIE